MALVICRQGNPISSIRQSNHSAPPASHPSPAQAPFSVMGFAVCLSGGLPSSFRLNFSLFLFLSFAGPGKQMSGTPWSAHSHAPSSLFPGSNCCSVQRDKKALKVMTLVLISHMAGPYPIKS